MNREDFVAPPCACIPCQQAGVSDREQIRDRYTGAWLHGGDLRRWYAAKADFEKKARAAVGKHGRHAQGFEPLVNKR